MLKNIRLHIEKDEQQQEKLEEELAQQITSDYKKNINSFQRNIPSLLPYIKGAVSHNISIFCNKYGEFNIVDYGVGRVLYGFHPEQEINQQVDLFDTSARGINLATPHSEHLPQTNGYADTQEQIDCLVVLGLGLGYHIKTLLLKYKIKHLIIYEPEAQYLKCSAYVTPWHEIFALTKEKSTNLYFQMEKDGRDIVSDIEELSTNFDINEFYLYQHYNHILFNSITQQFKQHSWSEIKQQGLSFKLDQDPLNYIPTWSSPISSNDYQPTTESDPFFLENLSAFKQFFPDIYKEFQDYSPKYWLPYKNSNGDINLINKQHNVGWYSNTPKEDCLIHFTSFQEQPNKDGLLLGYKGKKLAHYLHYKMVKEAEELLEKASEEVGGLPESIKSIIVFGIGAGYQLEYLSQKHEVEKLFICEPNPDFFYASLFAIDWGSIFQKFNNNESRIYINIGDQGANLFRDLLNQFYSIGPYILNNTYFYQSYYNSTLNSAIAQLREQLQIVISMGEYFDHAYFGIAHTKESFKRHYPILKKQANAFLTPSNKEVPVFIVGNGPSLDSSIEVIKEWSDKAIIVSCGTSLQVMYHNGITPDFHAEIEQNRSSFDWASVIGDLSYLKEISLISCNGIHPDTAALYRDVFITMKEGESSTVSALGVLEEELEVLQFAFPTVANFVCNLFIKLNFENIYLLGIDLGFIDDKHHHSKQSGYYNSAGGELYNYTDTANTSLLAPGNFRAQVYTKHEFKVSRMVLEQILAQLPKNVNVYNCSDGAKITGAQPLYLHNILSVNSIQQKHDAVSAIKEEAFSNINSTNYINSFTKKFDQSILKNELQVFKELIDSDIETFSAAESFIEKQKELLFVSYQNSRSLLFYYLYGSVNFVNAMLTKLLFSSKEKGLEKFAAGQSLWRKHFEILRKKMLIEDECFDLSYSPNNIDKRTSILVKRKFEKKQTIVFTNSTYFVEAMNSLVEHYDIKNSVRYVNYKQSLSQIHVPDYVIYHEKAFTPADNSLASCIKSKALPMLGKLGTLIITDNLSRNEIKELCSIDEKVAVLHVAYHHNSNSSPPWIDDYVRISDDALISILDADQYHVFLPKYSVAETQSLELLNESIFQEYTQEDAIYLCYKHALINLNRQKEGGGKMSCGYRGTPVRNYTYNQLIYDTYTQKQYLERVHILSEQLPHYINDTTFK